MAEDKEELRDDWVDEVLGLGVWVNLWMEVQALETAGSMLLHFQGSVSYLTRGQVLMLPTAFHGEVFAAKGPVSSIPVAGCPSPFLSFLMNSVPDTETQIAIPQMAADISADLEFVVIKYNELSLIKKKA